MGKEKHELNIMRRKGIEKLCRDYGVEPDIIDIDSYWDNSLSYAENKEAFIERLKKIAPAEKVVENSINMAKIEAEKREALNLENEHYKEKQRQDIAQITSQETPKIDKFFEVPINLVIMIARGHGHALMFGGKGGLGKTFTIMKTLQKEKMVMGKDFAYKRGYTTVIQFVKWLYDNQDMKLLFIDDIEGLFQDERGKAVLKSALDNGFEKRFVNYDSTSKLATFPSTFEITARIITCANDYPKDSDFRAVIDRCIYHEIRFEYREILEILKEMIKLPYKNMTLAHRKAVYNYIINHTDETIENFSLRTLHKLYDCFLYAENGEMFDRLAKDILTPNPLKAEIKRLMDTGLPVNEQVKEFIEKTGSSRRSYFRYKKEIVPKCQRIGIS